jgi:hypothetical protein
MCRIFHKPFSTQAASPEPPLNPAQQVTPQKAAPKRERLVQILKSFHQRKQRVTPSSFLPKRRRPRRQITKKRRTRAISPLPSGSYNGSVLQPLLCQPVCLTLSLFGPHLESCGFHSGIALAVGIEESYVTGLEFFAGSPIFGLSF